MFLFALSFLIGDVLAYSVGSVGDGWLLLGLAGVLSLPWLRTAKWWLLAACLGYAYAGWHIDRLVDNRWPDEFAGEDVVALVRIDGIPEQQGYRTKFNAQLLELSETTLEGNRGLVRLSWYGNDHELVPGEIWKLKLRLKPPRGFSNPGGFDYERWLFRQHVVATGYVRSSELNKRKGRSAWAGDRLRLVIADAVAPQEGYEHSGVMRGLLIGDRSLISDAQWDALLKSGTNHLLAISGLHIGIAAGIGYATAYGLWWLWPMLALRLPRQKAGAIAALPPAILYAMLAGFTVPTQRALIMLLVISLATLIGRFSRPFSVLGVGLLAVLLWDSTGVLDPGFWLSFTAVAIIFLTVMQHREMSATLSVVRIQLMLSLGLAPLTLLFFSQASLISPLANLVAVPYVSLLVVPLLFLGALASSLAPWLGALILEAVDSLLAGLFAILRLMTTPEWSSARYLLREEWEIVALLAISSIWVLPRGVPVRMLPLVLLIPLALSSEPERREHDFDVTFLDVGQGLSIVVETAGHTMVYDTGPGFKGGRSAAESVLLPYLEYRGITRVDQLVVSHADSDHAGGTDVLLAGLPVSSILASEPVNTGLAEITPVACIAGQHWVWGQVRFEVLHPSGSTLRGENDRSCVLRVSSRNGSVILTGDVEKAGEREMVERVGNILQSTVMLAAHHGSSTSSSSVFLEKIRPNWVVVSAGYRNRFGFPKEDVLSRYHQLDTTVIRTDEAGAIRFSFSEASPEPLIYQHRQARCTRWTLPPCEN